MWPLLFCLLQIWDVCVCLAAIQELLAAVFIWLWGQYTEGFADKKIAPQLNALARGGSASFDAWGLAAWGGILQHVGGKICLCTCVRDTHVWQYVLLWLRFPRWSLLCNNIIYNSPIQLIIYRRLFWENCYWQKHKLNPNSSHAWKSLSAPQLTRPALIRCRSKLWREGVTMDIFPLTCKVCLRHCYRYI